MKRPNDARELLRVSPVVTAKCEVRGVPLVLGVGASPVVVIVSCANQVAAGKLEASCVEHLNASFPHLPLPKKPTAPVQERARTPSWPTSDGTVPSNTTGRGGSAGGGGLEARAVELVLVLELELAALLVVSCGKVRQEIRELR